MGHRFLGAVLFLLPALCLFEMAARLYRNLLLGKRPG